MNAPAVSYRFRPASVAFTSTGCFPSFHKHLKSPPDFCHETLIQLTDQNDTCDGNSLSCDRERHCKQSQVNVIIKEAAQNE